MLILGHRGAIDGTASQNSRAAFESALAAADGFETDACLSKDGMVFLVHDSATIAASTAAEVAQMRLKKGETVPVLRDILALVGKHAGKILNIELKGPGTAQPVLDLLRQSFAAKQIEPAALIISSFDHFMLKPVRAALPELKIGALFEEKPAPSPLLDEIRPDLLIMPEKSLTPDTDALASRLYPAVPLCGWTVTERNDYDQVDLLARLTSLPRGRIGAMIVDHPAAFVAAARDARLIP